MVAGAAGGVLQDRQLDVQQGRRRGLQHRVGEAPAGDRAAPAGEAGGLAAAGAARGRKADGTHSAVGLGE